MARDPWIDDAVFDALSDEQWHFIGRQFTFTAYFLFGLAAIGIGVWQAYSDPSWFWAEWYRPAGPMAGVVIAAVSFALRFFVGMEIKRLQKRLKALRPELLD